MVRLPFQRGAGRKVEARPVGGAGGAEIGSRGIGVGLGLLHLRRSRLGLGPDGGGIHLRRDLVECGVVGGAHSAVLADQSSQPGLGGGQIGLGLDEVEPSGAERHERAQRVGPSRRSGVELGDRDLELLFRALHAGLANPDELGCRQCVEELIGGREGLLESRIHQRSAGGVCAGAGRLHVGAAPEAGEQVDVRTSVQRLRSGCSGCRR